MTGVQYKLVPGWPDYSVGDDGSVWTSKLGAHGGWRRMNAPQSKLAGYPKVTLSQGNVQRHFHVHRLVLLAFAGKPPQPRMVCRHLNGDPSDNRLANLAWGTFKENEQDKADHGRRPRGSGVYGSKLTDQLVTEIRQRFAFGETIDSLADQYGLARLSMIRAIHGNTWSHIPLPDYSARIQPRGGPADGEGHHSAKLTAEKVRHIREQRAAGLSERAIAEAMKVSRTCVSHVVHRRTWDHVA